MPRPPALTPKVLGTPKNGTPRVWVLRDGQPVPAEVKTGASDGRMTEVTGGAIEAGTPVVTEALATKR